MNAVEMAAAKVPAKPNVPAQLPKSARAILVAKPKALPPSPTTALATCAPKPTHRAPAPITAEANDEAKPNGPSPLPEDAAGQPGFELQTTLAGGKDNGDGHSSPGTQNVRAAPDLLILRIFSEVYEDLQKQRIATANRMERGGIDPAFMAATMASLDDAEHQAALVMRRAYRVVVPEPIRLWQKETVGIGEHLLARLIGVIGHPVHTTVYEWQGTGTERILTEVGPMDRTVSQLWSYCGHGDALRKRRAGMSADEAASLGNPRAKTLVHLLAEACMKQRSSPYRPVYDAAREEYEARDWTDLHRHNAALRKVGKAILKDLWIVAGGGQGGVATQSRSATSGREART